MLRPRVLLIDDESVPRFAVRRFLTSKGFDVEEADDCASAKIKFRAFGPDITVLDFRLPDGNALDLLADFRTISESPVIVLTAYASIDNAVEAVKLGAEQFFTKPVELDALLLVINRILENRRNQRQVMATTAQATGARMPTSSGFDSPESSCRSSSSKLRIVTSAPNSRAIIVAVSVSSA